MYNESQSHYRSSTPAINAPSKKDLNGTSEEGQWKENSNASRHTAGMAYNILLIMLHEIIWALGSF